MDKPKITHKDFMCEVDELLPSSDLTANKKFNRFLMLARSVSLLSTYREYQLGAIIKKNGRVISRGFNSYKTHPMQKKYNEIREKGWMEDMDTPGLMHAEFAALMKVKNKKLDDAELFVYRIDKLGNPRMARPCAGCMEAIKDRGIKQIHYTTPDGVATEYLSKEIPVPMRKSKRNV